MRPRTAPPSAHEYAAGLLAALAVFFVLEFRRVPALITGLLPICYAWLKDELEQRGLL